MVRYISLVLCLIILCGCGSKTRVILLPDETGKTGTVIVKTQSSSTTLNEPYTYTNVEDDKSTISINPIEKRKVEDEYRLLLGAEPEKPVYFTLYFEHDSIHLTKASLALIPEIVRTAKEREPSEISVIGHTDTKGTAEYNNKLSLQRAKTMAKILKESDLQLKNLSVTSHGENDPLILTKDGVSEQKNRRVEIMIR